MKLCFKCNKEKSLDHFYRHPQMADGHLNKCKECNKSDVRKNRLLKIEYYRNYDRKRQDTPEAKKRREAYALKKKNDPKFKLRKKSYTARYQQDNPLKRAAHVQWGNFIRSNPWMKPNRCSACENSNALNAHHEDYTKPLSVTWLCKNCHGARHREINEEIRNGVDWSKRGF